MAFSLFYVGIYSHQCVITDAMHSTVSAISMRLEYCIHISEVLLPMLQYHLLSVHILFYFQ